MDTYDLVSHSIRWSNQGYCGETSLLQSAMGYGTWISQLNARTIATTFSKYPQSGQPEGKPSGQKGFLSQV